MRWRGPTDEPAPCGGWAVCGGWAHGSGGAATRSGGPGAMTLSAQVIVFAKAPVAGQAKTRLIPALGAAGAAALAERLLDHAVAQAVAAGLGRVVLCVTPDAEHPAFQRLRARHSLHLTLQGQGDLGQRMHRALARALAGAPACTPTRTTIRTTIRSTIRTTIRTPTHTPTVAPTAAPACATPLAPPGNAGVLLMGSDAPALSAAVLRAAAAALADADVVLVPALDGGYVLVGLRRPAPTLFAGVAWSTGQVMAQTRQRAAAAGLRLVELPALADIDLPADLVHLQHLPPTQSWMQPPMQPPPQPKPAHPPA